MAVVVMTVLGLVGHWFLARFGAGEAQRDDDDRGDVEVHGRAHLSRVIRVHEVAAEAARPRRLDRSRRSAKRSPNVVRKRIVSVAGLAVAWACVAGTQARERTVAIADPPAVELTPEPAPSAEPEPVPMIEISAAAMEPLPPAPPPAKPAPFDDEQLRRILAVEDIVAAAATEHGVEPALVNGGIWVESKFEPRARGPGGSQGLMQLMPKTAAAMAKQLGRKRASYDPDFNIHAGTLLLSRLLARFDGDVSLSLAAYNRGSGIVAGWVASGEPLPERTQAYVDRVLEARDWFDQPLPAA